MKIKKDKDIVKNSASKTRFIDLVMLKEVEDGSKIDDESIDFFAERDSKTAWEVIGDMETEGFEIDDYPAFIKMPKGKFDNVVPTTFPDRKQPDDSTHTWKTYRDAYHTWFEYESDIYFSSNTYGVNWTMTMLKAAVAKTSDNVEILSYKEFNDYKATQE